MESQLPANAFLHRSWHHTPMFIYIFESNSCSLMYPCISLKHVGWLNPTSLLLPKQLPPSINCASNSKLPFFVGKMAQKHFPKLKMFNSSGIFWDLWGIWGPWPSHNPGNCLPAASTTLAAAATACAAAEAAVAARQPLLRQGASKPCESRSIGGPGWGHQVSSSQHAERWCLGNMKIMKHDMKQIRCNSGTLKLLRIWLVMSLP